MLRMLVGTAEGIIRLERNQTAREGELPAARFLAHSATAVYALTGDNALWRRDEQGEWSCVNARCVEEDVWAFACD
ncbi:MAG TPA: exo-alpha-sialidase, partial [Dehalococcoidia bacterium]